MLGWACARQSSPSRAAFLESTHLSRQGELNRQPIAANYSANVRNVLLTGMLSSPSSSSTANEPCWGSACWAAVVEVAAVVAAVVAVGGGGATAWDLADTDGATGCDLDAIDGVPTRDFEDTDGVAACCLGPGTPPVVKPL